MGGAGDRTKTVLHVNQMYFVRMVMRPPIKKNWDSVDLYAKGFLPNNHFAGHKPYTYQYVSHQHLKRVTFGIFVILCRCTHVCKITLKWSRKRSKKKMPSRHKINNTQYSIPFHVLCVNVRILILILMLSIIIYDIGNHGNTCDRKMGQTKR